MCPSGPLLDDMRPTTAPELRAVATMLNDAGILKIRPVEMQYQFLPNGERMGDGILFRAGGREEGPVQMMLCCRRFDGVKGGRPAVKTTHRPCAEA
ncbi:MAG: hypothetical protein Kow0059_06910 [Candidatus Sumerlaeia bacterium]